VAISEDAAAEAENTVPAVAVAADVDPKTAVAE
jgi:hypothetical protein